MLLSLHNMVIRRVMVQANTVPATFWALAFLLLPDNAHYRQQILFSLQPDGSHGSSPTPPAQQQEVHDAGEPLLVPFGTAGDKSFSATHDDLGRACIPCQCLLDGGLQACMKCCSVW